MYFVVGRVPTTSSAPTASTMLSVVYGYTVLTAPSKNTCTPASTTPTGVSGLPLKNGCCHFTASDLQTPCDGFLQGESGVYMAMHAHYIIHDTIPQDENEGRYEINVKILGAHAVFYSFVLDNCPGFYMLLP